VSAVSRNQDYGSKSTLLQCPWCICRFESICCPNPLVGSPSRFFCLWWVSCRPILAHSLLPPPPCVRSRPCHPRAFCRSVWDDYEADTELIGRGAFARVFRALQRDDGSPVAIKVIGRETKAFPQQRRGEPQQRRRRRSHLHCAGSLQDRDDAAGSSARQQAAARTLPVSATVITLPPN
jgi:hypothetical protein